MKVTRIPGVFSSLVFGTLCTVIPAQAQPAEGVPDLSGRWESIGWFGGFDPAPPYDPPQFSAEGLALKMVYDDETENPVYDCIGPGVPSILIVPYMLEITQLEEEVILYHEYFDTKRSVRLDRLEPPGDYEPSIFGYSTGRYEGGALVVETRGFSFDRIGMDMSGGPSSDQKRVIERYTRSEDGETLHVEFIVEDPVYLESRYVREREYRFTPDQEIYPFECEPEVAGRTREMYEE